MNNEQINILLIEDNPGDARLVMEMLVEAGAKKFNLVQVERISEGITRLGQDSFNVILLDLSLPDGYGLDTLDRVCAVAPHVPVLVLTALDDEYLAIKAVQEGAQDYLIKGQMNSNLLVRALRYAIERKQAEEALRSSEEEAKRLAKENAIVAEIGRIISSTLNIEEVYDHFSEEVRKLIPFDRIAINLINFEENNFVVLYTADVVVPSRQHGNVIPLAGSATEEVVRTRLPLFIQMENKDELARRYPSLLSSYYAGIRFMISVPLISKDQVIGALYFQSNKPNAYTEMELKLAERVARQIAGAIANAQLFAEHKRAEEENTSLQEQLRQSQKMEAIGRLAGGIAHDFNNLLTIIKGYSQLSLLQLKEDDPLKGNIEEIQKATQRATDLTRQLLVFSRRQILEMRVIDLNALFQGVDKMLRRVIGEDIELATLLADDLGRVKTDPGQIEQVIMNLAVNARDAMPKGGKLTIETANVELDEKNAGRHAAVKPGHYVMLSISDTGCGMTPEVKDRVFEPFFTTKEKDKGTGLGLSTVYGIIKQSGGNIWVYSKPRRGTTFKIYLPQVEEPLEEVMERLVEGELPQGNETVLVVEDDEKVRRLAVQILQGYGYRVLEAFQEVDAFLISAEHEGPIHLLLTDVVMPKVSGRELADRIASIHPEIKILYMSGYTDNAIIHHGVLEEGINYIQKPFSVDGLARKVREVLDN